MKTHIAQKPYYIIVKDGKYITGSKIVLGRNVVTGDTVEWFDTEEAFNARRTAVGYVAPKAPEKK